jgi:hypothetical protein
VTGTLAIGGRPMTDWQIAGSVGVGVIVGVGVMVGVCVAVGVRLAVRVAVGQPIEHASQQLGQPLTCADPPNGARHWAALFLIVHFLMPLAVVRQQATAPRWPQVDLVAHFFTVATHSAGSIPSVFA